MTTTTHAPTQAPARPVPVQRFRLGSVTLAIWKNTDRTGRPFFTTSIVRRFRTSTGEWKNSASLRAVDLPVVRSLTEQASHWLSQQETTRIDAHGIMTPATLASADEPGSIEPEFEAAAPMGTIQPVNSR